MSDAPKYYVGQEVMTSTYGSKAQLRTVTKVGRMYVTAGRDEFRIDTGALKSGYSGRIYTLDAWAEMQEVRALEGQARERGVEFRKALPLDRLRRIVEILEEDA